MQKQHIIALIALTATTLYLMSDNKHEKTTAELFEDWKSQYGLMLKLSPS